MGLFRLIRERRGAAAAVIFGENTANSFVNPHEEAEVDEVGGGSEFHDFSRSAAILS